MSSNLNASINSESSSTFSKQNVTNINSDKRDGNHQVVRSKLPDKNETCRLMTNTSVSTSSSSSSSDGQMKNHKVEGKNKKSLHQKQHQQQQQLSSSQNQQRQVDCNSISSANNRRVVHQKNNPPGSAKSTIGSPAVSSTDSTNICTTLEDFSKRAQELKGDINKALEKQRSSKIIDQPMEVVKLKEDILKLSGLDIKNADDNDTSETNKEDNTRMDARRLETLKASESITINDGDTQKEETVQSSEKLSFSDSVPEEKKPKDELSSDKDNSEFSNSKSTQSTIELSTKDDLPNSKKVEIKSETTLANPTRLPQLQPKQIGLTKTSKTPSKNHDPFEDQDRLNDVVSEGFEPLNAKLDLDTKYVTLVSSLQKHFTEAPYLLEPVCRRLVRMSEQNDQLTLNCEKYQAENTKLLMIKQKLENLCRELQKSNNAIRIESLDLIKVEQGKAKEQTTKIQSTLSGVIKLFDENQQRNMSLRQENQDLQTKLKSLLDHCDNWEKSVEVALRQKDIENRLIKTELAKSNLLKNEEKEKFIGEKQELLQILSMMQEQQHRIEGQEAKLRMDLSCYASKYDECQAVISKGMTRFQTESERMLKQIERSKEDYKILLSKYESSNKKMAKLLEEKQYWDKSMKLANKKIDTLEKLCRALRERKLENKSVDNHNTPSAGERKGKATGIKNEAPTSEPTTNLPIIKQVTEIKSKLNQPAVLDRETGQISFDNETKNLEAETRDKNHSEPGSDHDHQTQDSKLHVSASKETTPDEMVDLDTDKTEQYSSSANGIPSEAINVNIETQ